MKVETVEESQFGSHTPLHLRDTVGASQWVPSDRTLGQPAGRFTSRGFTRFTFQGIPQQLWGLLAFQKVPYVGFLSSCLQHRCLS